MSRRDEVVERIRDCESVISELENTGAWKIILKDMESIRKRLDDNWQNIPESDVQKRQEARIGKLASAHILSMVDNYKTQLFNAKGELYKLDNPGAQITKDYDTETKVHLEGGNYGV